MSHGRRDVNHGAIRDDLRRVPGIGVEDTADTGDGYPDLMAHRLVPVREIIARFGADGMCPMWFALEVKSPGGVLRPDQKKFQARARGPYSVVQSLADALRAVWLTR